MALQATGMDKSNADMGKEEENLLCGASRPEVDPLDPATTLLYGA